MSSSTITGFIAAAQPDGSVLYEEVTSDTTTEEALAAMVRCGVRSYTVEAFAAASKRVTKAKHNKRHESSGKFLPLTPLERAGWSDATKTAYTRLM